MTDVHGCAVRKDNKVTSYAYSNNKAARAFVRLLANLEEVALAIGRYVAVGGLILHSKISAITCATILNGPFIIKAILLRAKRYVTAMGI